jgi:hypothetical protein
MNVFAAIWELMTKNGQKLRSTIQRRFILKAGDLAE